MTAAGNHISGGVGPLHLGCLILWNLAGWNGWTASQFSLNPQKVSVEVKLKDADSCASNKIPKLPSNSSRSAESNERWPIVQVFFVVGCIFINHGLWLSEIGDTQISAVLIN
jgi:hypothetical protein